VAGNARHPGTSFPTAAVDLVTSTEEPGHVVAHRLHRLSDQNPRASVPQGRRSAAAMDAAALGEDRTDHRHAVKAGDAASRARGPPWVTSPHQSPRATGSRWHWGQSPIGKAFMRTYLARLSPDRSAPSAPQAAQARAPGTPTGKSTKRCRWHFHEITSPGTRAAMSGRRRQSGRWPSRQLQPPRPAPHHRRPVAPRASPPGLQPVPSRAGHRCCGKWHPRRLRATTGRPGPC